MARLAAIDCGDDGIQAVVIVQFFALQFLMRQAEIEGHYGKAVSLAFYFILAVWPGTPHQLAPSDWRGVPEVGFLRVKAHHSGTSGKDRAARLHDTRHIPQAVFKLAQMMKREGKQKAVVGIRWHDVLVLSKIAKDGWFRFGIDIDTVYRSKVVAISVGVDVPIDLQDVAGDEGAVPLKESIHIVPVQGSAAISPVAVREWLEAPQVSPSRQSFLFNTQIRRVVQTGPTTRFILLRSGCSDFGFTKVSFFATPITCRCVIARSTPALVARGRHPSDTTMHITVTALATNLATRRWKREAASQHHPMEMSTRRYRRRIEKHNRRTSIESGKNGKLRFQLSRTSKRFQHRYSLPVR